MFPWYVNDWSVVGFSLRADVRRGERDDGHAFDLDERSFHSNEDNPRSRIMFAGERLRPSREKVDALVHALVRCRQETEGEDDGWTEESS